MAAKSDALVASLSKNVHTAEMLIEMVRNYPVLYDKRHPKHKDSLLKDDLWRKIGSELGLTGMQAQAKFKNLKDTFTKHKNKIKDLMRSGAGAAEIPTVKWVHFEAMMSLVGPALEEPIASSVDDPGPTTSSSTGIAEEGQLEDDSYVAVVLDEPSETVESPPCATPANIEAERPRKVPRTAASDASSSQTVSHVDIAAECLNQLRAVKASQGSKENHDFPYFSVCRWQNSCAC
ncbi:hypothetical protein HPB50_011958 [Hyalomma asiaticum]|uniref:Uncharacterized protein n=1 Tax=Hyalomma asiaticum TaxID=266040 RepID=A0ACB7TBZ9_HYAAI|nr:hypothetical protein HPB50_011958 [Hyalomma asiaticum]